MPRAKCKNCGNMTVFRNAQDAADGDLGEGSDDLKRVQKGWCRPCMRQARKWRKFGEDSKDVDEYLEGNPLSRHFKTDRESRSDRQR